MLYKVEDFREIPIKFTQEDVDTLLRQMESDVKDFKIVYKEDDDWWRANVYTFFAFLLFEIVGLFSKKKKQDFYHNFHNAMKNTLVLTNRRFWKREPWKILTILRHERQHLLDWNQHPIWFPFSYVFVAPCIFTMRAHWEWRGYEKNLITYYEASGYISDAVIENIVSHFTGGMYFYMMPFKKTVTKIIREKARVIMSLGTRYEM